MIIRRTLLIISAVLAVMIASGLLLLTGGNLAKTINGFLPNGWKVAMSQSLSLNVERGYLPHFSLSYQGCPLLTTENAMLQWQPSAKISIDNVIVDYRCLATLPESEASNTHSLESLKESLAGLPRGSLVIKQLSAVNLPNEMQDRLKVLLSQPSTLEMVKKDAELTASLQQQGGNFALSLTHSELRGKADYQFSENEKHQLNFTASMDDKGHLLPLTLAMDYHWALPEAVISDATLQRGRLSLYWQTNEVQQRTGELAIHSHNYPENQLLFPFVFNHQSLDIQQGKFNWQWNSTVALRGFLTAKILPNSWQGDNLFPIKTALRLSLLSENEKGKGNVVLNSPEGEWNAERVHLPLNIHGNVKQGNFILYSAMPLLISGEYHDPTLRFLPLALVRLTGKERFLDIQDLRFPLAGIRIDKYGINGRLQAIFKGESPDFSQIKWHLDGYANHFNAGQHSLFQIPPNTDIQDRWQWRFWGSSRVKALRNQLQIAGRGNWQGDRVALLEFNGDLGKMAGENLMIPKLDLSLLEPIILDYKKWQLKGGMRLNAPQISFAYGGELLQPTADLNFEGELENLRLKGEVSAGTLGPIRLFARRQLTEKASELIGRLYWQEQPASVFQSLLPFRSQWVITGGKIRGETAFSANVDKGLVAGGHFAIRQGKASFPSGELNGIEFNLPYQYQGGEINLGVKQALEVKLAEINVGLPLRNVRVEVQGHYPYSAKRPLWLRELSLELLGGYLNVEQLALPQRQEAYFNLRDIDLEKVLEFAQYHQLDLKGKLNATLPFWLNGKPCYICNGTFSQQRASHLRFTPQILEAIKQSGYTEQLLTYLVNDSVITSLSGKVQVAHNGDMQLGSSLKMHLNEHQKARINLNYTHKENLFDLWKLISFGSQFEQHIEHQLYQKWDKR